ncbi:MAG: DNA repair protein RadC [Flavobacteriaceae bacterium]|nr:DNA repair protein RadC [Flavobacteriaceae bacterium]
MTTKEGNFSIKKWNIDDRPREKLLNKGCVVLSDAELVAILIGSGNREESAVRLAKRILNAVDNNIQTLAKLSIADLMQFKGIGEAKAVSIVTALELGKRRRLEKALEVKKIIGSKAVFEIMQPLIGDINREEFWVLYLNNSNVVLSKKCLSRGGITGTVVDTRLVFKPALAQLATAIILCHNHPSGTLVASESDKKLTHKIKRAGETLDIKVLDHLIITEKMYFSFADEGML